MQTGGFEPTAGDQVAGDVNRDRSTTEAQKQPLLKGSADYTNTITKVYLETPPGIHASGNSLFFFEGGDSL